VAQLPSLVRHKEGVDPSCLQLLLENAEGITTPLKYIEYTDVSQVALYYDGDLSTSEIGEIDYILSNYESLSVWCTGKQKGKAVTRETFTNSCPSWCISYSGPNTVSDEFLQLTGASSISNDRIAWISPYNSILKAVTINHRQNGADGYLWILRMPVDRSIYSAPDLLYSVRVYDQQEIIHTGLNVRIDQQDRIAVFYREDRRDMNDAVVSLYYTADIDDLGENGVLTHNRNTSGQIFRPWYGNYWNV